MAQRESLSQPVCLRRTAPQLQVPMVARPRNQLYLDQAIRSATHRLGFMKRAYANSATFTHAAWLASDSN